MQIKYADTGEVFTVEEVEPGVFQSVFPTVLAGQSSLHTSEQDAWQYIFDETVRFAMSTVHKVLAP